MNYAYCKCGARTPIGLTIINFCATCGKPFNASASVSTVNNQTTPAQIAENPPKKSKLLEKLRARNTHRQEEDEEDFEVEADEDGDEYAELPNLTENPLELVIDSQPNISTIQDLARSATTPIKLDKGKKISAAEKKKIINLISQEGSSSKRNKK